MGSIHPRPSVLLLEHISIWTLGDATCSQESQWQEANAGVVCFHEPDRVKI